MGDKPKRTRKPAEYVVQIAVGSDWRDCYQHCATTAEAIKWIRKASADGTYRVFRVTAGPFEATTETVERTVLKPVEDKD